MHSLKGPLVICTVCIKAYEIITLFGNLTNVLGNSSVVFALFRIIGNVSSLGQEDLENFHGKPVAAKDKDGIIAHIQSLLHQGSVPKLAPGLPTDKVGPAEISDIKLPSPPNYTLGDKVYFSHYI